MAVYELSGAGSVKTGRTNYTTMNANNQFGAMVPIANAVGTGSSNNIVFANIPQTFQDLIVVGSVTLTATGQAWMFSNGFGATTYSGTKLQGNGTSATSTRDSSPQSAYILMDAGTFGTTVGSFQTHILNYANTTTFKTVMTRTAADQNGSGVTQLTVGLKQSTSAITQLEFNTFGASNFTTATTITLYGIRAVSS